MKRVFLILSVLVLTSLACGLGGLPSLVQPTPAPVMQVPPPVLPDAQDAANSDNVLVALYAQVLPGVVSINTGNALGSGFVIDTNGHIVTNQHVVDGASELRLFQRP